MKSYISRKFPLETRITDQTFEFRSEGLIIGSYDSQKSPLPPLQDRIEREMKEPILVLASEDHASMGSCCLYIRVDVVVGGENKLSCSIFKKEA
jgi:hypothetical protein